MVGIEVDSVRNENRYVDIDGDGDEDGDIWDEEPLQGQQLDDGALLLSEEEDETEWMGGESVDPIAEKIFFGEKIPFCDLGEKTGESFSRLVHESYVT